jgi:hypothetical protein
LNPLLIERERFKESDQPDLEDFFFFLKLTLSSLVAGDSRKFVRDNKVR